MGHENVKPLLVLLKSITVTSVKTIHDDRTLTGFLTPHPCLIDNGTVANHYVLDGEKCLREATEPVALSPFLPARLNYIQ